MSAILTLENVGGLKGKQEFELKRGKVNVITGPNGIGKSSVTKGLALLLSTSTDRMIFDEHCEEHSEALALGIVSSGSKPRQNLVNIHSDRAKIELINQSFKDSIAISRAGAVETCPQNGNSNFLYAGILSKYSRLFRNIQDGRNDFQWIVQKLSLAKYYDKYRDELITPLLSELAEQLSVAQAKEKGLRGLVDKQQELVNGLQRLRIEKEKLSKVDETLAPHRKKVQEKVDNLSVNILNLRADNSKIQETISGIDRQIVEFTKKKNEIDAQLRKIQLELKEDQSQKLNELKKKIEQLVEKRYVRQGELNVIQPAIDFLRESGGKSCACPLCNSGQISLEKAKSKYNTIHDDIEKYSSEIAKLNRTDRAIQNRTDELKSERADLLKEQGDSIFELNKALKDSKNASNLKGRLSGNIEDVKDKERQLVSLQNELTEIDKRYDPNTQKKLRVLSEQMGGIEERLRQINNEIENSKIVHQGITLHPSVVQKILEAQIAFLKSIEEHCTSRSEEQQQKARKEFNLTIGKMIERLDFEDLKEVHLNQENQLFIERLDAKTKKVVLQDIKTLAESEKLIIAIMLQIALKETYLKDVPFLVLDDIQDFDDNRRKVVMDYLTEKARDNNWCVVVTAL